MSLLFRCLHKSGGALQYSPTKCAKIALSCFLLNNRCIERRIPLPVIEELPNGDDNMVPPVNQAPARGVGRQIREELVTTVFTR